MLVIVRADTGVCPYGWCGLPLRLVGADILAERKDVAAVQALVVDRVDETTGEEDAESADGSVLDGEGGVGIGHSGWVEGYALVADDELQAALVGEGLDVAMILAGLPSCVSGTLNDKVLTFLNRARKYELGPLATGDVDAFFLKAFRADGIKIDRNLRRSAAAFTEGSPYLMQLVGHYLVSYTVDGVVDSDAYEDALQSARAEFVDDVCATTVAGLSNGDVAYLKAMQQLGGNCRTSDVAAVMEVTPDYGQQYRKRLLDAGIIKAPRKGIVCFDVPFLADCLSKE